MKQSIVEHLKLWTGSIQLEDNAEQIVKPQDKDDAPEITNTANKKKEPLLKPVKVVKEPDLVQRIKHLAGINR